MIFIKVLVYYLFKEMSRNNEGGSFCGFEIKNLIGFELVY